MTRATIKLLSIVAVVLYIGVMSLWLRSQRVSGYDARARAEATTAEVSDKSESEDASEHWSDAWERNSYRWSRTTGEEGAKE